MLRVVPVPNKPNAYRVLKDGKAWHPDAMLDRYLERAPAKEMAQ